MRKARETREAKTSRRANILGEQISFAPREQMSRGENIKIAKCELIPRDHKPKGANSQGEKLIHGNNLP